MDSKTDEPPGCDALAHNVIFADALTRKKVTTECAAEENADVISIEHSSGALRGMRW